MDEQNGCLSVNFFQEFSRDFLVYISKLLDYSGKDLKYFSGNYQILGKIMKVVLTKVWIDHGVDTTRGQNRLQPKRNSNTQNQSMTKGLNINKRKRAALKQELAGMIHSLQTYYLNIITTMDDENVKNKIPDSERQSIRDECTEVIAWLMTADQLPENEEEEDKKQRELDHFSNCVAVKLSQVAKRLPGFSGNEGAAPCTAPGAEDDASPVE